MGVNTELIDQILITAHVDMVTVILITLHNQGFTELCVILNQTGIFQLSKERQQLYTDNLLNRQFNPNTLNTWWSGDITYLRSAQGWLYLAIVMDLYSRKIVSCAFSDKPDSALTIRALRGNYLTTGG